MTDTPDPSMPDPEDMGCGVKKIWETKLGDPFYGYCRAHDIEWNSAYAGTNPAKSSLGADWRLLTGSLRASGLNPLLWARAVGFFTLARAYGFFKWPKPTGAVDAKIN